MGKCTSDKKARSSLRNALYLLRDALGEETFLLERQYVALDNDALWVDVEKLGAGDSTTLGGH
jgi:DNA-binding SARP family transcriptional activator